MTAFREMRGIFNRRMMRSVRLYSLCVGVFVAGYVFSNLQSSGWCKSKGQDHLALKPFSTFLVVVVFTAPGNIDRRQAVRQTWLRMGKGLDVLHFFAVGSSSMEPQVLMELTQENREHRDMLILGSVRDSFSELSRKLREVLVWVDSNMEFEFLLKVDDDSFARLDAIHAHLLEYKKKGTLLLEPKKEGIHLLEHEEKGAYLSEQKLGDGLYWGFFDGQARVKRNGKWQEEEWFLCDRYLPYAKGGGYVISRDLVHLLVGVAEHLSLYRNEDVSLGAWLAPFAVHRVHDPRFDTEYVPRGCSNSYLVTHKQSPSMMRSKYASLVVKKNLCASEFKTRNSYQYDWSVLPSQCCSRNDSRIP